VSETPAPSDKKSSKKAKAPPKEAEGFEIAFPLTDIVLREKNVRTGDLPQMDEMTASIGDEGIIQPLTVVKVYDDDGKWTGKAELDAGYRRYWAARGIGLKVVPVRFVNADEARKHRIAMIENLQRADMNGMDIAQGIKHMMDLEDMDQKTVASSLGVSEGYVSQHLALLKLPQKAQVAVRKGKLELTHARALGRLKDEETVLKLLPDAPSMTAADLNTKVEFLLQKEKAAKEKEKEKEEKKDKPEGKTSTRKPAGEPPAAPEKKSLAERYAEMELAPLNKTTLREKMMEVALKLDRAESEAKRAEYKYTLKGLEIAAGVK
jgi:ParB family chromosome partitioning protein